MRCPPPTFSTPTHPLLPCIKQKTENLSNLPACNRLLSVLSQTMLVSLLCLPVVHHCFFIFAMSQMHYDAYTYVCVCICLLPQWLLHHSFPSRYHRLHCGVFLDLITRTCPKRLHLRDTCMAVFAFLDCRGQLFSTTLR